MSWFTWGKKSERKEYAETMNEEKQQEPEKRADPLDAVDTSHVYHVVKRRYSLDSWFEFEAVAMDAKYHPATGSVELTIQGESITLNKEEFEDLRRVLHAFAHDPKFNEGAEELVVSALDRHNHPLPSQSQGRGKQVSGINLGNIRDAYFFAKVGSPLERELGAALDIIDAQQLDINELGEEVDSLNSQIEDLEVDLDTAYAERDAMENEAADLEGEVRRLEEELVEAQS